MNNTTLLGEYLSSCGHVLPTEQRSALQSSLIVLKTNSKLARVQFWGKIFGSNRDYLIAQGFLTDSFLGPKKLFCSHDGVEWVQMPDLTQETLQLCAKISGPFTGDASSEYIVEVPLPPQPIIEKKKKETEEGGSEAEEESEEEEEEDSEEEDTEPSVRRVSISEEKRLTATVMTIDKVTAVVPRGGYMLTAEHRVLPNPCFQGLSSAEASQLKSYCHLRDPCFIQNKTLLEREGLSRSLDFLDTIDEDVPKGCWSLVEDKASVLVSIRSLLYPGFYAFHVPGTPSFGHAYFGTGEKNSNIGFML